jgi:hypothetical protein
MADIFNFPDNYRIEVSGWGLDNIFFVEKTDLLWSPSGVKQLLLHHSLLEGAMIFVRLLASESMKCSVPVIYQVEGVEPMDRNGQCEMRLQQMPPRLKAPYAGGSASYMREDSLKTSEPRKSSTQPEPEEILQ